MAATSSLRTVYPLREKETAVYSFTLKDEGEAVVPASQLTAATLTLYSFDSPTKAIINSRDAQNVKNANNVTISEEGVVTWAIQVADVTIQNDALQREVHRALFLFTWNSADGVRSKPHEVDLSLLNLGRLT